MAEQEEDLLKGIQERNLESTLLKARKVFLWTDVNDESAKAVVTRLLSLDTENAEQEIVLYINSPGGSIHDGLAIYDAMQAVQAPVSTVCTGMAASMGAVLLAGGATGRRYAWPHARVMIHQPLYSRTLTGTSTDLEIHAREIMKAREEINRMLAGHTGQSLDKITQDTDRDFWMSAQEAKEYGMIDEVITTVAPGPKGK